MNENTKIQIICSIVWNHLIFVMKSISREGGWDLTLWYGRYLPRARVWNQWSAGVGGWVRGVSLRIPSLIISVNLNTMSQTICLIRCTAAQLLIINHAFKIIISIFLSRLVQLCQTYWEASNYMETVQS